MAHSPARLRAMVCQRCWCPDARREDRSRAGSLLPAGFTLHRHYQPNARTTASGVSYLPSGRCPFIQCPSSVEKSDIRLQACLMSSAVAGYLTWLRMCSSAFFRSTAIASSVPHGPAANRRLRMVQSAGGRPRRWAGLPAKRRGRLLSFVSPPMPGAPGLPVLTSQ